MPGRFASSQPSCERAPLRYRGPMDAVLFDMDDTLYDQAEPFANAVRRVLGTLPASPDALFRASRRHSGEIFAAYEEGGRPTDAMYVRRMRATMAEFGVEVTDDVARELQRVYASRDEGAMSLSPAMAKALGWCVDRTPRGVGIVTNGTAVRQRDKCAVLGLWRWVDEKNVFVSDELGCAKPDARIFLHACDAMGARPDASLFVGDSYEIDVVGAHDAGMRVVWLDRRGHPAPTGTGAVRADWVVRTDDELLDVLRRVVR